MAFLTCTRVSLITGAIVLLLEFNRRSLVQAASTPFDFGPYPECNEGRSSTTPPKLASQFSLQAEMKQLSNTGDLVTLNSVDGYYDSDADQGTTVLSLNGIDTTYIYNFVKGDAYIVYDNLTCGITTLFDSGCNPYAVFLADLNPGTGRKAGDLCNFTTGPFKFIGDTTVRAIPARKWAQCVFDQQRNVVSINNYYSAKDDGRGAFTQDVPLRFENKVLNGTADLLQKVWVYDFIQYKDAIDDTSVFLPPAGAYCPTWYRENKTMPSLLPQFTLTLMTVAQHAKEVHNMRMYFDQKTQQAAFFTDSATGTRFPPSNIRTNGSSYFNTVHDYNSGLSFVMPFSSSIYSSRKNCTVTPIDSGSIDAQDPGEADPNTVRIRTNNQLFGMNSSGWIYIGERDFSNVRCYVWVRQERDTYIRVTEMYWMKEEWTASNVTALFGIIRYRRSLNGTLLETFRSSVIDYDSVSSYGARMFDLSSCLRTAKPLLVSFTIQVKNYTAISGSNFRVFSNGVRDALASTLATNNLRFVDMEFSQGVNVTNNQPTFWFTLLEWPSVSGGRPGAQVQKSPQAVVDDLSSRLTDDDLALSVAYNNKTETVSILKGTVQSGVDLLKPRVTRPPYRPRTQSLNSTKTGSLTAQSPITTGYTSGDMTGLAFAMILIGGVGGAVGGFLLQKRKVSVPYQQDPNL